MISIPKLHPIPGGQQLHVKDEPFLMRAAELQNSSMSSARYMKNIWPKLKASHINTVLGAVPWDMIEPREGEFAFEELDEIIADARSHDLHLILLWFGSFKNGLSTYVPGWVKRDDMRFPRACLRKAGGRLEVGDVLSLFHTEGALADARAFGRLMSHVREIDEKHSTVIMVQVENEVGLLGDSRDASPAANEAFSAPVPADLTRFLRESNTSLHPSLRSNISRLEHSRDGECWEDKFGKSPQTDELFMAYHCAKYVEQVAAAGRSAYELPLYTNVWQNYAGDDGENDFPIVVGGGGNPGDYPSGGGVVNVLDVWSKFAPSLDFVAPDIYLNNYERTCHKYRHGGQPLFIPEQRRDEFGARRIWSALGNYQALGAAPFGIDTSLEDGNPFKRHYQLVEQTSEQILQAQRSPGASSGFFFDELNAEVSETSRARAVTFGQWELQIDRAFVFGKPGPGYGMIIHEGDAQFLLIGEGYQVTFRCLDPRTTFTGIQSFTELEVTDAKVGKLRPLRRFGGDETRSGSAIVMPSQNPDYGDFPISL
ncbi:Hypothetical protein D9617_35g090150 [Elsinoe fawcettii]|nr:Hypothetical protein D9617_35g090150 [Elsinoe fawcettii]